MPKLLIAGSAKLQKQTEAWRQYWTAAGHEIIGFPEPIAAGHLEAEYPRVFKQFFEDILTTDVLFIMNEDKNGILGYIGAEVFAEAAFAVGHNQIGDNLTRVIIMKMPDKSVQSYDEICLWLKLGWAELFKPSRHSLA